MKKKITGFLVSTLMIVFTMTAFVSVQETGECMDIVRYLTGADILHNAGITGDDIRGMVVDEGFGDHNEFIARKIAVWGDPPERDHGTWVLGTIFSGGIYDEKSKGMLPEGKWFFNNKDEADIIMWVERLVSENGVFVSCSFGNHWDLHGQYSDVTESIDRSIYDNDVTIAYAAGNHETYPIISTEATAKNIIAVGGIIHNNNIFRSDDSWDGLTTSKGPTNDQRIKPDICAARDQIYTTDYNNVGGYETDFHGTSAACPQVSGSAGLIYQLYNLSHWGDNWEKNQNDELDRPHASAIKALLINHAYQYDLEDVADRDEQGWGFVDIGAVYTNNEDIIFDEYSFLAKDSYWEYDYSDVSCDAPLKITLVWTDEPGKTSNRDLKNDLDLIITDPEDNISYGNYGLIPIPDGDNPNPSNWDESTYTYSRWSKQVTNPDLENPDSLNNVENVFIQNPVSGTYTIKVKADSFYDQDALQSFSLVISNTNNAPRAPVFVAGDTSGTAGEEYDYTFVATDYNLNNLFYLFDWGDGTDSGWVGTYESDVDVTVSHTWTEKGNYDVMVKAKDTYDAESDWATLEVSMPKNKAINTPFFRFLENHPHLFPLLRQLLRL